MKKIVSAIMCAVMMFSLSACKKEETQKDPVVADENSFVINIINKTEDEIAALDYEYGVGAETYGSGGISNADSTPVLKKGETATIALERENFDSDEESATSAFDNMEEFFIDVTVLDEQGKEYMVRYALGWVAEPNRVYSISINGSYENGFELEYIKE